MCGVLERNVHRKKPNANSTQRAQSKLDNTMTRAKAKLIEIEDAKNSDQNSSFRDNRALISSEMR